MVELYYHEVLGNIMDMSIESGANHQIPLRRIRNLFTHMAAPYARKLHVNRMTQKQAD
jgi:hypothetical protein